MIFSSKHQTIHWKLQENKLVIIDSLMKIMIQENLKHLTEEESPIYEQDRTKKFKLFVTQIVSLDLYLLCSFFRV